MTKRIKSLTNEQVLINFIKNADPVVVAMMRTILLQATEEVINNKEEVTKAMQKSFMTPEFWIHCNQTIHDAINFNE